MLDPAATGGSGSGSVLDGNGNGGGSGAVKGATAIRPPAPGGGATDITLPLLFVILLGLAAFGLWRLQQSRRVSRLDY